MGKLIHFDNFFQIFKNVDWYISKFLESTSEPTVLTVTPTVNTEHFAQQKRIQKQWGTLLTPLTAISTAANATHIGSSGLWRRVAMVQIYIVPQFHRFIQWQLVFRSN
jgi:hypothetical protein